MKDQSRMRSKVVIFVVIPALNEEASLPRVLADIPDWVNAVYVADNGSTDKTSDVAADGGAIVVQAVRQWSLVHASWGNAKRVH